MIPDSLSVGVKQPGREPDHRFLVHCKSKVVPVRAMKEYWESEGIAPLIPHLRADGSDWQAPLSD